MIFNGFFYISIYREHNSEIANSTNYNAIDDFAKVMMATPTFSRKDSQPEASLLDGRRALLAFARGKARGTTTLGESKKV